MVFYDESFLMGLASMIRMLIRVDMNSLRTIRGKFARVCVELDLTKLVVGKVDIEGFLHNVKYEGLNIICTKRGCYGHKTGQCGKKEVAEVAMMV